MDKNLFVDELEKLREFSSKLKLASENNNELVAQLNAISKPNRETLFSIYQNSEGPVKGIRKVVSEILNKRDIQLAELDTIIKNAKNENPKSFGKMYKSWFNMLYMFLIVDFRTEMNKAVEYLSNSTIEELNVTDAVIAKKFDFTGERETGSTRCWVAFINKTHQSQSTAKQLFINIENGQIEYCLYDRPKDVKTDKVVLQKGIPFQFDNYISTFKKNLKEIIDDNWVQTTNYWRVGTSDGTTNYWEEMKSDGKICIGWSEIGDLAETNIKNKKGIIQLFENNGFYKDDNKTKSRKAGEIFNFFEKVKEGDIVLAQDGAIVFGIGKIKSEYQYNENADFPHQKEVEWLLLNPQLKNDIGLRTTVYQIEDKNKISEIENLIKNPVTANNSNKYHKSDSIDQPLNQILYGPPGTGKTYNTINKALEIIGENIQGKTRLEIKTLFDAKMKEGLIVFTTFHQSMSYEDFIEGIKPIEPTVEGQPVIYKVIPGILKEICERIKNIEKLTSNSLPAANSVTSFDNLYSAFIKRLKEIISELEENETHSFESRRSRVKLIKIEEDNSILTTGETANSTETVTKDKLERIYNKFSSPDEITNLVKQLREVGTDIGWTTNYFAVFKALKEFETSIKANDEKDVSKNIKQNYVLIIDEINRGNVSQIFGELITLIEKDKRLGKEESLEVTLPYSKEKFGVPQNLYIIGTMNTADRSVEALDAALRRRFSFEEMPPKPELIASEGQLKKLDGILETMVLPLILKTINGRIEKLLDKDHQIGHSYFMTVNNLKELKSTFQNNIIPLLQEYFFGDYGKMGLVIGSGFFETIESQNENLFADFNDYDASEFAERIIYKVKNIAVMTDDDFKSAINLLLKK